MRRNDTQENTYINTQQLAGCQPISQSYIIHIIQIRSRSLGTCEHNVRAENWFNLSLQQLAEVGLEYILSFPLSRWIQDINTHLPNKSRYCALRQLYKEPEFHHVSLISRKGNFDCPSKSGQSRRIVLTRRQRSGEKHDSRGNKLNRRSALLRVFCPLSYRSRATGGYRTNQKARQHGGSSGSLNSLYKWLTFNFLGLLIAQTRRGNLRVLN